MPLSLYCTCNNTSDTYVYKQHEKERDHTPRTHFHTSSKTVYFTMRSATKQLNNTRWIGFWTRPRKRSSAPFRNALQLPSSVRMNLGFIGEVHYIDLEVGGICRVRAGSIDELLIVPRKHRQSFTLKMAIVTFVETSGNFYSPVRPIPKPLIALNASHESFRIRINSCNLIVFSSRFFLLQ